MVEVLAPGRLSTVVVRADWWLFAEPEDRPDASGDRTTNALPSKQARKATSRARVLVVDDDADIRTMLRTQLELEGYTVTEAADGDQAWASIQQDPPTVVVADVMMPGRSGLELCTLARAAGFKRIGFVAFTAGMATWEECRSAGFDARFLKTDPLPRLTQTIRRLLSR